MKFEVSAALPKGAEDKSRLPLVFREFPPVDLTEARRERLWEFDFDGGLWTVNGMTYDPNRIDAGIEQDSAEIWKLRNVGNSWSHPIHSHFTEFIILEINGVPQYQYSVQESDVQNERKYFAPRRSFLSLQGADRSDMLDRFKKMNENAPKEKRLKSAAAAKRAAAPTSPATDPCDDYETFEAELKRKLDAVDALPQSGRAAALEKIEEYRRAQAFAFIVRHVDPDTLDQIVKYVSSTEEQPFTLESFRFRTAREFRLIVILLKILGVANLDLRGNKDLVKGDGRFMGGPRRDVALLLPDWEVTVFMRWKDFLGKHVMHCHNVVHEDHAMMIRWDIVPPGHGFDTPKSGAVLRRAGDADSSRPVAAGAQRGRRQRQRRARKALGCEASRTSLDSETGLPDI